MRPGTSQGAKDQRSRARKKQAKQMGDDTGLAAFIRNRPCCACGRRPSVVAHILTRASGHGVVTLDGRPNVIPLCQWCHSIQHTTGWAKFRSQFAPAGFDEWVVAAELAGVYGAAP